MFWQPKLFKKIVKAWKGHSLKNIPGGLKYVSYLDQHGCVITQTTSFFLLIKTLFS